MIVPCAAGLMVLPPNPPPLGAASFPAFRGSAAAERRRPTGPARGRPSQVLRVWCPHGFWMLFGRDWLPGADPGEETARRRRVALPLRGVVPPVLLLRPLVVAIHVHGRARIRRSAGNEPLGRLHRDDRLPVVRHVARDEHVRARVHRTRGL